MSPFTAVLVLSLCGLSLAQENEPTYEEMARSFATIGDESCIDGFETVRKNDCVIKCINKTNPADIVEPYFLVRDMRDGCVYDTFINGQFPCEVKVRCEETG